MQNPKTIQELSLAIAKGEIDVVDFTSRVLDEVEAIDNEFHVLAAPCREQALAQAKEIQSAVKAKKAKGSLIGVPVSVKDCVCVRGVESRSSSAVLNGYKPVFDATAVARLKKEGAIIIGKTVQDEFGFGTFCTNVGKGFRIPKNPNDPSRVTGGSSGGAAALAKRLSVPHIAVCESTGGSIVAPASFCGVAGLCPTYGLVSRYGLIDYGESLDKIGAIAKTIDEAACSLGVMAGFDEMDATSSPVKMQLHIPRPGVEGVRIGVLSESYGKGVEPEVQSAIKDALKLLELKGAIVEQIALPKTASLALASYYVLAMAESSTNLARYCGMRYGASLPLKGSFDEYFSRVRSEYFGEEAKRRIMIGTFARMAGFRDAFYLRAATVRSGIIAEYKAMFGKVDVIVSPAMPIRAPKIEEVKHLSPLKQYAMDSLTAGPNLAGLPHGSVPISSKSNLPIGFMAIADHFKEAQVINVLKEVERK